ncbi:MAG: hypothetical protein ABII88_03535 [Candidatus Omnitrophota bacterium]
MLSNKSFYKNTGLKIFSLLLAIVIWIYIHGIVQRQSGGPLAYKDIKGVEVLIMGEPLFLGKNVFSVELEKNFIDLRVRGLEKEIEQLTQMDIVAYVNVKGLKPGKTYAPVVKYILPPKIQVIGAPNLVRVEIKDKNL